MEKCFILIITLAFIASLGMSSPIYPCLGIGLTDVGIDIKSLHRESLQLSPQSPDFIFFCLKYI